MLSLANTKIPQLQELIAPRVVIFYDRQWHRLGTKSKLRRDIASETGIDAECLEHGVVDGQSIAQRMSWAAKRHTTREEDIAYCLLGIFGINMPLLYGEGTKAFTRLQEEIIRKYDDDSIFAWASAKGTFPGGTYRSLLARSPTEFAGSGNIIFPASRHSEPFSVTNKGLQVQFSGHADPDCPMEFVATLESLDTRILPRLHIRLRLRQLSNDSAQYVRVESHDLGLGVHDKYHQSSTRMDVRRVFVREDPIIPLNHSSPRFLGICFDLDDWEIQGVSSQGSIVSLEGRAGLYFVPFSINFKGQNTGTESPALENFPEARLRFCLKHPGNLRRGDRDVLVQFDYVQSPDQAMHVVEYDRESLKGTAYLELPDDYESCLSGSHALSLPSVSIDILPRHISDELWFFADFSCWMNKYDY